MLSIKFPPKIESIHSSITKCDCILQSKDKKKKKERICHGLGKETSDKQYLNSCRMCEWCNCCEAGGTQLGRYCVPRLRDNGRLRIGHGTGEHGTDDQRLMVIWDLLKLEKVPAQIFARENACTLFTLLFIAFVKLIRNDEEKS